MSPAAEIQVRWADLDDDAVAVRVGSGVLLVLSRWLHPAQSMVLATWLAGELHSERRSPTTKRFPAGSVLGRTRELADRRLADLMDKPDLSVEDFEHVITTLCP